MSHADTVNVRPGEELDLSALTNYLATELPKVLPANLLEQGLDFSTLSLTQFPGGHSNLTYLLKLGEVEMVLRRPPLGPLAPTAHDMPREYRLLAAIHPHFTLAPRPYLLCEDSSVIGAPFYVMERRHGFVVYRSTPPQIGDNLLLRQQVSEVMIDTLAQLHAVDIYATGLSNIGKPTGFVLRQLKGWTERWQRAKTQEIPELEEVIVWLNAHLPAEATPATLLHNDFKLDNVVLDEADPTKVVAVLDWEMSSVGDPLIDVGIFLAYWSQAGDHPARRDAISPATSEPGWLTRAQLIARYAEKTGRDMTNIAFYETFAIFKVAVVLQQIYYRYACGQTTDARFQDFNERVVGLAQAALILTK